MNKDSNLTALKRLQTRAANLRNQLGISSPGEVIFLAAHDAISDESVVVEADGMGSGTTSVVAGNYPLDYLIKFEKAFPSEEEAIAAAEAIAFNGYSPTDVLSKHK